MYPGKGSNGVQTPLDRNFYGKHFKNLQKIENVWEKNSGPFPLQMFGLPFKKNPSKELMMNDWFQDQHFPCIK